MTRWINSQRLRSSLWMDINPEDRRERIGEWAVVVIARQIEHGSAVSDDYGLE